MVNSVLTARRRNLRTLILTTLAVVVGGLIAAPPALAASGTIATDGRSVNVRSGPGTAYSSVGSLANGATVTIYCVKRGEAVEGRWGWSSWWDKIDPNAERYVADALVYTGSMEPVAPECGSTGGSIINPAAYPFRNDSWNEPDGYTYYKRECVSFAAWAVRNDGITDRNTDLTWLGNAHSWGHDSRAVRRTGTPRPGDVAWWDKSGTYPLGHVAYVAEVSGNSARLYEYNERGDHLLRTDRWVSLSNPTAFLTF